MKHYVLGFAFSKDRKEIILVQKNRPEWQKGKLNGVGGKIEETDTSEVNAMIREFEEETGVVTLISDWHYFGRMQFMRDIMGGGAVVHLFRMFDDIIEFCLTNEDEIIVRLKTDTFMQHNICDPNLPILIPLALSTEFNFTELSD